VADDANADYWGQAEAGWDELNQFLGEANVGSETAEALQDRIEDASELTGQSVSQLSAFVLGNRDTSPR